MTTRLITPSNTTWKAAHASAATRFRAPSTNPRGAVARHGRSTAMSTPRVRRASARISISERLADYYLRRLDGRQVPPWDFDATGRDAEIKDTAAAAVTASALLEMARL